MLDPMTMPIHRPSPEIEAWPIRVPRPRIDPVSPTERREVGPAPRPRNRPGGSVILVPGRPIRPRDPLAPDIDYIPLPRPRPAARSNWDTGLGPIEYPLPARPPRGKKERKYAVPNGLLPAYKAIADAWNQTSDAKEFIDGIHDSLPVKYRKGKTLPEKMGDIYDHWDHIDASKALENLLQNWLEDKIVGGTIGAANRAGVESGYGHSLGSRVLYKGV